LRLPWWRISGLGLNLKYFFLRKNIKMSGVGPFGMAGNNVKLPSFLGSPANRAANAIEKAGNVANAAAKAAANAAKAAVNLTKGGKRKLKKKTRRSNRKGTRRNKSRSKRN